jgi:hypothetical protein
MNQETMEKMKQRLSDIAEKFGAVAVFREEEKTGYVFVRFKCDKRESLETCLTDAYWSATLQEQAVLMLGSVLPGMSVVEGGPA